MTNLTLEQAEGWIRTAQAKAVQLGVKVSVCVVDAGGNPVASSRMDGAGILSPDIARAKAYTAIAFKAHSKEMAERMKERPAAGLGLTQVSGNRIVLLPGGVLVKKGDEVVGAIGVSGATSDEDHVCGMEAASSVK
ncbi:MAG: heme-binding protein [Thaumarchaeota archaeon]|nr:heme-binding protein [Nitrososphaerota archaeon]